MSQRHKATSWSLDRRSQPGRDGARLPRHLLLAVDAGLFATICVAPFIFGGRHDVGRLVFVAIVATTAAAWFVRQSLVSKATWTRTAAHVILLLAVGLVIFQLVPLPAAWVARLAPRIADLLPLWTAGASAGDLGAWRTLSFTPHDTMLALAMLLSYGLLFVVVTQRAQTVDDVRRLLTWIGLAAVLMAAFGLAQYFASNGRFFWFYEHPFRTTDDYVKGSFINRNHFAGFLVLGVGPLVALLIAALRRPAPDWSRHQASRASPAPLDALAWVAAILVVLVAILLSLSRGGAVTLLASATVLGVIYRRWRLVDARFAGGVVALIVALFGLLSVYGYDKVAGRLDDFANGSLDVMDPQDGRRNIWAANVAAIRDGWLTGSGAGSHREIYPVYLDKSLPREYTHAENGYLQIATENGVAGAALLLGGIVLCGSWCLRCLRRLESDDDRLAFGAVAAGLAASAVHSLVDFVWYIPACISVTVILAACALRLAQFSRYENEQSACSSQLSRPRWLEMSAASAAIGGWCIYTLFGPAMAAVHWDRYLRASADNTAVAAQQLSALLANQPPDGSDLAEPLSDVMLSHLERAADWDPRAARVQLKLAGKCLARFEMLQQRADNAMPLSQIRAAALASNFSSSAELRAWLTRATGANAEWLYRALEHAKRAVALGPLQGEAYLRIAELYFLDGSPRVVADAFVAQAERVRPYDGDVLFDIGMQQLLSGNLDRALPYWARCFRDRGDHQPRIVQMLAGRGIPAAVFLEAFQPDWRTLREIWARYRQSGTAQDLNDLVGYTAQVTERQVQEKGGIPPAYIWLWQASIYTDAGRPADATICLQHAYQNNPHLYEVRFALARALMNAGRFAEAEPHVRWCLARRPENKNLKASLVEISKQRITTRDQTAARPR